MKYKIHGNQKSNREHWFFEENDTFINAISIKFPITHNGLVHK